MNYYEILNIKNDASKSEIRKSYKALIKKYHPDVYNGDKKIAEDMSMKINEAYEVLSDEKLRNEYDIELENQQKSDLNDMASDFYNYASNKVNEESNSNKYKENYTNNFYSKFYDSHIRPTEDFLSEKFDTLKIKQKIMIFLAFLFVICMMIFFTFLDYLKFVPVKSETKKMDYPNNFTIVNKPDIEDDEYFFYYK